ncbi:hypothetical protein [Reichenbachiella sp.]|uniref:hypothetical protein n=1 Tax=Reichenbachiella sp. TaxID=2184521 RepID=UPI003B5B33F8
MIHKTDISEMDQQICESLGIDQDQLFWLKLKHGCEFLQVWIGEEFAHDIKLMEKLPEYWAWWQQIWYNEDKRYLSKFKYHQLGSYINHHAPERIAYRPNSVVSESYHRLIKSLAAPRGVESNF